jgi:hypothetical protein
VTSEIRVASRTAERQAKRANSTDCPRRAALACPSVRTKTPRRIAADLARRCVSRDVAGWAFLWRRGAPPYGRSGASRLGAERASGEAHPAPAATARSDLSARGAPGTRSIPSLHRLPPSSRSRIIPLKTLTCDARLPPGSTAMPGQWYIAVARYSSRSATPPTLRPRRDDDTAEALSLS